MRIADDGEIMVRGPHIFQGYAGSPQATAEAMDGDWLFSGDLGHIDADGYLYITGRKKDLMTVPLVEHAVVCGDGRHYLSALLTINQDALAALAAANLITAKDLHRHPLVLEALQRGIDEVNARQARVAHIRKFSVLPCTLSIEAGDLTPTLKVKRKAVIERHQHLVDEMYEDKPVVRA